MSSTPDVFIVGAARTPIGRFLGGYATLKASDLGAIAIREAMKRAQEVIYVTERAVFRLTDKGVTLTEVAPGIDASLRTIDLGAETISGFRFELRDDATLREAGTDTARLQAATKGPVLWTIARKSVATQAWNATERLLDQTKADAKSVGDAVGLVVEGSTVACLCSPDFTFFVVHPFLSPERWKDGTRELIGRADCVVINRQASVRREPSPEVMAAIHDARPGDLRVADVSRPLDIWASDLLPRLHTGP